MNKEAMTMKCVISMLYISTILTFGCVAAVLALPDCDGSLQQFDFCGTNVPCDGSTPRQEPRYSCTGYEVNPVKGSFDCRPSPIGTGSTLCDAMEDLPENYGICTYKYECMVWIAFSGGVNWYYCGRDESAQTVNSTKLKTDLKLCNDTTGS